ncbi:hypothetical protein SAMD00019534_064720 [Acytostelium subglobosum LB1]|uniref:hypothetical protein n=1 Tax=Acytostelium subglobosum LB1 TaxID=1410327 RepID=UPI000644CF03|nr:hypothetical protein SAMD00019534_064720 [Acytostelium subglobosum LB1]GAM23297.1 hypothetical protein SAMD00019534_064720 [Acytostelium subglobosum LB1]|eukprot:XP_012753746.1 hypothetical protein SAMD00019534_064720 [Acytostelium subglobosum LB1]
MYYPFGPSSEDDDSSSSSSSSSGSFKGLGRRLMSDQNISSANSELLNKILSSESHSDDIDGEEEDEQEQEQTAMECDAQKGMCVECSDQVATIRCDQCRDELCQVCGYSLHRRGKRREHTYVNIVISGGLHGRLDFDSTSMLLSPKSDIDKLLNGVSPSKSLPFRDLISSILSQNNANYNKNKNSNNNSNNSNSLVRSNKLQKQEQIDEDDEDDAEEDGMKYGHHTGYKQLAKNWFTERSKYIPVRLTFNERRYLRLLESVLHVSEYTDKVDIEGLSRPKRIATQLLQICSILCGLSISEDRAVGKELLENKDFGREQEFFQDIFEIGRRHKIMNPEKMRSEYGKMIHLLQDSTREEIKEALGLNLIRPLKTVHSTLAEHNSLKLLEDPLLADATREILPEGKERYKVESEIKQKERAIKMLLSKYSRGNKDILEQCIYSIGDNHTYLRENRDSVRKMIRLLKKFFDPNVEEKQYSLQITPGQAGARLNHTHKKQFYYVYQSLTLWKKILHDMFKLWYMSENDLLGGIPYKLTQTGQGLNRVQPAPRISTEMGHILHSSQAKVGDAWVGSSVVHLGDNNVPNALSFIDKYTQISRILNPIVITINYIFKVNNKRIIAYIEEAFGGPDNLTKLILSDFFKHAFDGSGADNFFDAGSCIDGRLTSAWNWCSKIQEKRFHSIFLLAGFSGFDGNFN